MAKPELEDGYTQIPHEILEKLVRLSLPPNQWRVLLFIIRKTLGWHKKVDYIANYQIVEATGLCKAVVSRCLKGLNDMQLITRKGKLIGFQKDWEQWGKLAESSTSEKLAIPSTELAIPSTELAESSTKVSSCAVTQKIKDTISKETIQKKGAPSKKRYGEFENVLLSDEEYQKLKDKFGANVPDMIETLSSAIESKGYKYRSHYATILNWEKRAKRGGQGGTHRGYPAQASTQDLKDSIGKPLD